jgi:hypothetical protein
MAGESGAGAWAETERFVARKIVEAIEKDERKGCNRRDFIPRPR